MATMNPRKPRKKAKGIIPHRQEMPKRKRIGRGSAAHKLYTTFLSLAS
jgi:hypothetical protein